MQIDLPELIRTLGYFGLFGVIFAESWLLFFMPGDSLLFTAGFLASQRHLDLGVVMAGCFISAVAGNSIGYAFGHRIGRQLFRSGSFLFQPKHLQKAEVFYEKHGGKTIVLARFIPVVRTFAPIIAGVGVMSYRRFLAYNVVGGALWSLGLPLAGYYFGQVIPEDKIDQYLLPIIALIIVVSALPTAIHLYQEYRHQAIALLRTRLARR